MEKKRHDDWTEGFSSGVIDSTPVPFSVVACPMHLMLLLLTYTHLALVLFNPSHVSRRGAVRVVQSDGFKSFKLQAEVPPGTSMSVTRRTVTCLRKPRSL